MSISPTHPANMSHELKKLLFEREAVRESFTEQKNFKDVTLNVLEDVINRLKTLDTSIAKQYRKEADVKDEDLKKEFSEVARIRLQFQQLLKLSKVKRRTVRRIQLYKRQTRQILLTRVN